MPRLVRRIPRKHRTIRMDPYDKNERTCRCRALPDYVRAAQLGRSAQKRRGQGALGFCGLALKIYREPVADLRADRLRRPSLRVGVRDDDPVRALADVVGT